MQNNQSSFPKALFVAAALVIAFSIWPSESKLPNGIVPPAFAGVGVANDEAETLLTASADGKTIYMWQYFSSKPPKFIGQSHAELSKSK